MSTTPHLPVFLYDSMDKENAQNPQHKQQSPKISQKIDFRSILAGIFGGIVLVIFLSILHVVAWNMYLDYEYKKIGGVLLAVIYVFITIMLLGGAFLCMYGMWIKIQRHKLINIMEYQLTLDQLQSTSHAFIPQVLNVAQTRAAHSMFAGVQNLTYSPSKHIEQHEQSEQSEHMNALQEDSEELESYPSTMHEMDKAGLINRSGNSILIGFTEKEYNA